MNIVDFAMINEFLFFNLQVNIIKRNGWEYRMLNNDIKNRCKHTMNGLMRIVQKKNKNKTAEQAGMQKDKWN